MKKKLILLLVSIILPFAANAAEYSLTLSCPNTAVAGEEISCSINANTSDLGGISAKYSLTQGLEFVDLKLDSETTYSFNVCNSNGFSLGNTNGLPESFKVGVLKLKIATNATSNQEYKVSLVDLDGSDLDFNSVSGSNVSKTIRIKSDDNNLSSLTISGATLEFSKDILTYNVTINSETVTISGTAADKNAKVTGIGDKKLDYGENSFEITVTSEMGTKKTYTINVTREDLRSSNNNLKSLSVSNTKINYNNSQNYEETVKSDVEKVKIEAVAEDSNATIEGIGEKKLAYGPNNFEVVVTAENGAKKTYTIKIIREDNRSTDNSLKSLMIGDTVVELSDSNNYTITVDANKESIDLVATANSDKATINGLGTKTLKYGQNSFEIVVIAENEEEKVYTINITRIDDTEDNTLKSLTISNTNIAFDGSDNYTATVKNNISKVNIIAVANSERAEVIGAGYHNLEIGENKLTIKVIAANKAEKIYTINITRLQEEQVKVPNTSANVSTIIIVCIVIFVIIGIVILLKLRKDRKNKML